MEREELNRILELHKKWLQGEEGGKRADLKYTNLKGADLRSADLRSAGLKGADLRGANLRWADLKSAYLKDADLRGADLKSAYLKDADLRGADLKSAYLKSANLSWADLRGANTDFSVLPLWCGGLHLIVDARIARQIAYHFCSLECEDEEFIEARNAILDFANKFHRVEECGVLERR